MNETVLVTGAAGYIGSHACKVLNRQGWRPVAYDNFSRGHREFVKWGPLVEGDIRETDKLIRVLTEYKPIAVLHFAGLIDAGESVLAPFRYFDNNVAGTLSLVRAMASSGLRRIVFSSTCATYGAPNVSFISEGAEQCPVNPYGESKLIIEKMLRQLTAEGFRTVSLRYFNAAGADPDSEIGEWHEPESHLIPLAIDALSGSVSLRIFGSDYPTPDGTCIRDYVHVIDLAEAHVRALEWLVGDATPTFEALNLGTGRGYSNLEVIAKIENVAGEKLHYAFASRRPGDSPRLVADATRAYTFLKWRPAHSDLDTIIRTAYCWHKNSHVRT